MTCPTCSRANPADARYCIYCAALLSDTASVTTSPEHRPAIGPTTRLDPTSTPMYAMPAQPAVPGAARRRLRSSDLTGGIFLVGLGLLFLTGHLFPGILVVIGVTTFFHEWSHGRQHKGLGKLLFFAGLAVLFWSHAIFPGILFLLGLMALLNSRRCFC